MKKVQEIWRASLEIGGAAWLMVVVVSFSDWAVSLTVPHISGGLHWLVVIAFSYWNCIVLDGVFMDWAKYRFDMFVMSKYSRRNGGETEVGTLAKLEGKSHFIANGQELVIRASESGHGIEVVPVKRGV